VPRGISEEQAQTAMAVKDVMAKRGVESPLMLPRADLAEAHRTGYPQLQDADPKTVSAYVSHNLQSPVFWSAMGFDSNEIKQYLGDEILRNLRGDNPVFPRDKDVYRDSLKIAAGLAFETKTRVTIEGELRGRSNSDLEFFANNGRWPEEAPTIDAEVVD
jgi:hypothetical protein